MQRPLILVLIISCATVISCTGAQTPTREMASPAPTSASAAAPEASGGLAPPETGDTSAEDFAGTIEIVEKKRTTSSAVILREVRAGRHEKFDRVVFEFAGSQIPGYRVEYLAQPARSCGAGEVVEVAGQADLLVQLVPAYAHNEQGQATVTQRERLTNLPELKQMKIICDFEAEVQSLLGLAKANPFRVVELTNPTRLVVDVKH